MGVGYHHVHHAVRRQRVVPCKRFVDANGRPVLIQHQVFWTVHKPEVRTVKRLTGGDFAVWFGVRCRGLGVGRFETHAARGFHSTKHDL